MDHLDPVQKARDDVQVALRYANEKLKALEATGSATRVRHTDQGLVLDLPDATPARMLHHRNTPKG